MFFSAKKDFIIKFFGVYVSVWLYIESFRKWPNAIKISKVDESENIKLIKAHP